MKSKLVALIMVAALISGCGGGGGGSEARTEADVPGLLSVKTEDGKMFLKISFLRELFGEKKFQEAFVDNNFELWATRAECMLPKKFKFHLDLANDTAQSEDVVFFEGEKVALKLRAIDPETKEEISPNLSESLSGKNPDPKILAWIIQEKDLGYRSLGMELFEKNLWPIEFNYEPKDQVAIYQGILNLKTYLVIPDINAEYEYWCREKFLGGKTDLKLSVSKESPWVKLGPSENLSLWSPKAIDSTGKNIYFPGKKLFEEKSPWIVRLVKTDGQEEFWIGCKKNGWLLDSDDLLEALQVATTKTESYRSAHLANGSAAYN